MIQVILKNWQPGQVFLSKQKQKKEKILKPSQNFCMITAPMAGRKNYIKNYSLKAAKSTALVFLKILKMASLNMLSGLKLKTGSIFQKNTVFVLFRKPCMRYSLRLPPMKQIFLPSFKAHGNTLSDSNF